MDEKLIAADALFGFAAWLTTRQKVITVGSSENAAQIAELLKEYCNANNISSVSDAYPNNLVYPDC